MTVKCLIEKLSKLPQDSMVTYLWDGCPRSEVQTLWLAKSGNVVLSELGEVVYNDTDRPISLISKDKFWYAK